MRIRNVAHLGLAELIFFILPKRIILIC